MEIQASHTIADCLRNPVVVRTILEHFPTYELLELSLVNKLWNYEARSVMKKQGNVLASLKAYMIRLGPGDVLNDCTFRPCQERLEAFTQDLQQMNVVPFSGMGFSIGGCSRKCPTADPQNQIQDFIVKQLPFQKISIGVGGIWWRAEDCPQVLLLKKVLRERGDILEEISISMCFQGDEFVKKLVRSCSFPRLQILKFTNLGDSYGSNLEDVDHEVEPDANFVWAVVSRAHNLQELHIDANWPIDAMLKIVEGTSAVLVHLHPARAPFKEFSDKVNNALRLEVLALQYTGPEFNFERFNRIAPMLLQASCTTTLREVCMDAVLAVPLMCYGICLQNVQDLEMHINHRQLDRRILMIVKNFDFTRIFPKLNKVRVESLTFPKILKEHVNGFVEQANAVLRKPLPDRAVKINRLELRYFPPSNVIVKFFAEMFPRIEKLDVTARSHEVNSFDLVWNDWAHLKELDVHIEVLICNVSLVIFSEFVFKTNF